MTEYNPEAPIRLQFSNRTVELNINRTTGYTHRQLGHKALNHLFLTDTDEEGKEYGFYMWYDQFGLNDEERDLYFNQTLQAMMNYGYTLIMNIEQPSETDMEQYIEKEAKKLDYGWD